jgi:carboxypeptidase family protein
MMAVSAQAGDCSKSKEFELVKRQALSGSFQDPSGAVLSGIEVQLLSGKKVVRDLRTDNLGRYDFGEVGPGKYKIRIEYGGKAFCAPQVRCKAGECRINPILEPNPKNYVLVD